VVEDVLGGMLAADLAGLLADGLDGFGVGETLAQGGLQLLLLLLLVGQFVDGEVLSMGPFVEQPGVSVLVPLVLVLGLEDDLEVGGDLVEKLGHFFLLLCAHGLFEARLGLLGAHILVVFEEAFEEFEKADAFLAGRVFSVFLDALVHAVHVVDAVVLEHLAAPLVLTLQSGRELPDPLVLQPETQMFELGAVPAEGTRWQFLLVCLAGCFPGGRGPVFLQGGLFLLGRFEDSEFLDEFREVDVGFDPGEVLHDLAHLGVMAGKVARMTWVVFLLQLLLAVPFCEISGL
jgi:hypothetical protein